VNGTSSAAETQVQNADRYLFSEAGILGERVPVPATGVTLSGDCRPCTFNWSGPGAITFPRGNYTISYHVPVQENHLSVMFDQPYRVAVTLPDSLEVSNPALGMVSPGAVVTRTADNRTIITWNSTRSMEIRFYDREREDLFYFFANFWILIAVVLLLPFVLTWRRK
jgi:hypothetical protein